MGDVHEAFGCVRLQDGLGDVQRHLSVCSLIMMLLLLLPMPCRTLFDLQSGTASTRARAVTAWVPWQGSHERDVGVLILLFGV